MKVTGEKRLETFRTSGRKCLVRTEVMIAEVGRRDAMTQREYGGGGRRLEVVRGL